MDKKFKSFNLKKWQQFDEVNLEFHKRLTVITGINGSGKTTVLSLLARKSKDFTAVPRDGIFQVAQIEFGDTKDLNVGNIEYTDGHHRSLNITKPSTIKYQLKVASLNSSQLTTGKTKTIYIPSHRKEYQYSVLNTLEVSNNYLEPDVVLMRMERAGDRYSAFKEIKSILIEWNFFGEGNSIAKPIPRYLECFREFEAILKKILPRSIGFYGFKVENFELILQCKSGDFLLESASGGLSAIIELAWRLFLLSGCNTNKVITVIMDEPENHLHPALQRQIIPVLLDIFTNAQFIVATHSPHIVSSVEDSKVYAFVPNEQGKIISQELDMLNRAANTNEVLRQIFDLPTTLPIWAEMELKEIIDQLDIADITKDNIFAELQNRLKCINMEYLLPEAITELVKKDR